MKKTIVCILCPKGCSMEVTFQDNQFQHVKNNLCKKGIAYAKSEIEAPMRQFSTFIPLKNSKTHKTLPVKTSCPVPKELIFPILKEIKKQVAIAPIAFNQIIIPQILGQNCDIIATREVLE
jgi:CxxC motif-containing protein